MKGYCALCKHERYNVADICRRSRPWDMHEISNRAHSLRTEIFFEETFTTEMREHLSIWKNIWQILQWKPNYNYIS